MHIAIIDNGISGVTAARFILKLSDHRITIISAESDHFFSWTALMYIYREHTRFEDTKTYEDWLWEKNRSGLLKAHVETVDAEGKKLILKDRAPLTFDRRL